MLKSQEMRKLAPEMDPLRIGTGWKKEDLEKPQIMVESTYGDSHPGSGHLNLLVEEVRKGVAEAGGFGARYFCTDICDGESQGTDGINYSLASREMIANMIEIHANATPFDGGVYLSSCDKGMPGNLIGLARVDIPAIVVPGGTMNAGPEMLTGEARLGEMQCLPELRCLFVYRNGIHDADHGGGTRPCPAWKRSDAGDKPGSSGICTGGRPPGGKTGTDGAYAAKRSCDEREF